MTDGEVENLATAAAQGINTSQNLRNALWLNGRTNPMSADFYMILEYAEKEFIGRKGSARRSDSPRTLWTAWVPQPTTSRHSQADVTPTMESSPQCGWTNNGSTSPSFYGDGLLSTSRPDHQHQSQLGERH